MSCLFCSGEEKASVKPNGKEYHFKPRKGYDFICSNCVTLLAGAEQDDLKKAHAKAIDKGLKDKASALESFIIEDEYNVRKTKKLERDMERKRPLRKVRPSRDKVRA